MPKIHLQLITIILRRGATLDRASSVLTLLGLLIGLAPLFDFQLNPLVLAATVAILVLGLIEKYWAQRVAIDAELFSVLTAGENDIDDVLSQLDTALHKLGLTPATTTSRSLADRSHGALRLFRLQAIFLGAQCLVTLAVCIMAPWLSLYP